MPITVPWTCRDPSGSTRTHRPSTVTAKRTGQTRWAREQMIPDAIVFPGTINIRIWLIIVPSMANMAEVTNTKTVSTEALIFFHNSSMPNTAINTKSFLGPRFRTASQDLYLLVMGYIIFQWSPWPKKSIPAVSFECAKDESSQGVFNLDTFFSIFYLSLYWLGYTFKILFLPSVLQIWPGEPLSLPSLLHIWPGEPCLLYTFGHGRLHRDGVGMARVDAAAMRMEWEGFPWFEQPMARMARDRGPALVA